LRSECQACNFTPAMRPKLQELAKMSPAEATLHRDSSSMARLLRGEGS
jgi:hypothetical protein